LYAGVGVFSAFAAPNASLVTLVESYPPAVTDADENLNDLDNVDVIEGSVEDALESLDEAYDAAIVDPGSRGLSKDVIDGLVGTQAARIVYVSDDPASLARDAKRLVHQGYRLLVAQPLDFAPQTYYLETAALFVRK
jgi:23S rRNA (uracil1939-C5)-methyltransferase